MGDPEPDSVPDRIRSRGVEILSLPAACAPVCARAFAHYRARRQRHSGRSLAAVPLPDFFIGAHSQVIGARLATADTGRYRTYFPALDLVEPET